MDEKLTLRILTPEGSAFEGDVEAVFLPGTEAPFEVLPEHAPIISSLSAGVIRWRVAGLESSLDVRAGAVLVNNNSITVCAEKG
jgi:F-type H+-transporting ATPase subunit epsilon